MKLPVGVKVFAHNQRFCGKNPVKNEIPAEILKTVTEGEAAHDKVSGKAGRKLSDSIKKVEARQSGNQKSDVSAVSQKPDAPSGKTEPEKPQGGQNK